MYSVRAFFILFSTCFLFAACTSPSVEPTAAPAASAQTPPPAIATDMQTVSAQTDTPVPSPTETWATYQNSFEEVSDPAAGGISAISSKVTVNTINAHTGKQSLEVKNPGAAQDFGISFSMSSIAGKETLDLSNKSVELSAFIPVNSSISSLVITLSWKGSTIWIPVREDMGIKGRWFREAVNLAEAVRNRGTIVYGNSWEGAQSIIRHCDTISLMGKSGAGKSAAPSLFLVDDLAIAVWTDPVPSASEETLPPLSPHGMFIGSVIINEPHNNYLLDPGFPPALMRDFNLAWIGTPPGWPEAQPAHPDSIDFDYASIDTSVAMATANRMAMKMFTTGWNSGLPRWLLDTPFDQLQPIMENRIAKDMGRYAGKIALWDVFNETVLGNGTGFRNRRPADTSNADQFAPYGYDYSPWVDGQDTSLIRAAFAKAKRMDPNAKLFLNEFENEQMGKPKSEYFYQFVSKMKSEGVPIDGVGFQLHLFIIGDTVGAYWGQSPINTFLENVNRNVQRFNELGMLVEFSEVEVAVRTDDLDLTSAAGRKLYDDRLQKQAQVYAGLMKIAKENKNVTAFIFWEISDAWSTIYQVNWPVRGTFGDAAIFDTYYQPKPAYTAALKVLKER
jgi:endo-1,4-beta-xylanase